MSDKSETISDAMMDGLHKELSALEVLFPFGIKLLQMSDQEWERIVIISNAIRKAYSELVRGVQTSQSSLMSEDIANVIS
jgi:hypothetical protein